MRWGRDGGARRRTSDEAGTATLLVVTLAAAVLVCTLSAVVGGRLLSDQRRAAAAADLAALAGAAAVQRGSDGCSAAEHVAAANGAVLTECRARGDEVRVAVRTDSVRFLGRQARPRAEARAGPVGG